MKNLDVEGVGKKLTGMARRIMLLTQYKDMTFDEYLEDDERQAVVERYLEVIIQAAIDINRMLIKSSRSIDNKEVSNKDAFTLVGQLGIITPELAISLIPSAGFRNILAHAYDDIMPDAAYSGLQLSLVEYPQYIRQVKTYINSVVQDDE